MNTFNPNANDLFQNVKMVISETKKPKVSPNVCAMPAAKPAKKLKNSDIFLYPKCKMEKPFKQEDVAVMAEDVKEPETPPTLDAPIKRDVGERGKDKKLRKKRRDHNTPERLAQLAKAREKALAKRRENSKRRKQEKEEALRKKYAPPAPPAPAPPKATPKKPKYTKEQVEASMFSMLDKWDDRRQMRKRKAKEEEAKKAAVERKKPSSSDKKIPSLYARNQQTNWDSLFY
jgi:hypothetical protein